jgi:hypothetical protein
MTASSATARPRQPLEGGIRCTAGLRWRYWRSWRACRPAARRATRPTEARAPAARRAAGGRAAVPRAAAARPVVGAALAAPAEYRAAPVAPASVARVLAPPARSACVRPPSTCPAPVVRSPTEATVRAGGSTSPSATRRRWLDPAASRRRRAAGRTPIASRSPPRAAPRRAAPVCQPTSVWASVTAGRSATERSCAPPPERTGVSLVESRLHLVPRR